MQKLKRKKRKKARPLIETPQLDRARHSSPPIEVGERLRVKLPGVTKKLKAILAKSPIDLDSSSEYELQQPVNSIGIQQNNPPADIQQQQKYH